MEGLQTKILRLMDKIKGDYKCSPKAWVLKEMFGNVLNPERVSWWFINECEGVTAKLLKDLLGQLQISYKEIVKGEDFYVIIFH